MFMLDDYKDTQNTAYGILSNAINNNKISHAYLIETLGNNKGFDFAISFAKALLCPKGLTNNKNCENCNQCKLIDDNNYIELEIIETNDLWLKKDSIDKLQKDFNFKPIVGKRKIYIIKNAEKIRESLANTLLKFIEEPEEGIIAILVTDNKSKILDTIISRCQVVSLKNTKSTYVFDKNEYSDELISSTIKFVNYYEERKLETIVYTNDLFHSHMKDRNDFLLAFNLILMYYNDVLNYKLNGNFTNFKDYINDYTYIENLSVENILKKINIVIELKKTILNNVNVNLLIDKLVIWFKKVDDNDIC